MFSGETHDLSQAHASRGRPRLPGCRVKNIETGSSGARPTPGRANRLGSNLTKIFNLAIRWEIRTDNQAVCFIRNPEDPRERFLNMKEIGRLSEVLAAHKNKPFADIIRMLMLNGARRGEALNAC